ncbi:MAG TPA: S8 family serine peptidase [Pyrinomonadaceae bacterium]|nr:S8 family serine peptidase [Pyrinomonadaceae bacterium]
MNRQNFFGHLALALTLIALAAFAGQMRRWRNQTGSVAPPTYKTHSSGYGRGQGAGQAKAEVLVRFRAGTPLAKMKEIAARLNDRFEDKFENIGNLAVFEDKDGYNVQTVLAQYRALDEVEYAEANQEIRLEPDIRGRYFSDRAPGYPDVALPFKSSNDPKLSEQWSLHNEGQRGGKRDSDIRALSAWAKTTGSERVVVAVIDSGVDYTHPDLVNNIWVRPANINEYTDEELGTINDEQGYNAVVNSGDPMDDNGHGTHCAGIIGAQGDNSIGIAGINWEVEIMPLKFISSNGSGTTKDAIEAINYVIDRKRAGVNVRIISASWGSTAKSSALREAIKRASDEGILFIAAAGNSSADSDRMPHYPAGYDLPNVVSVAASDRNDQLASFSNYGAKSVHIAAPGAEILSTWLNNQYEEHSGTSMATPEVAGVAALILSIEPKLTVKELRDRLFNSVDKLDSLKGKVSTGGRLNAARAVGAE